LSDNKLLLKVPILILYPAYFIIMGTYAVLLFCLRSFFLLLNDADLQKKSYVAFQVPIINIIYNNYIIYIYDIYIIYMIIPE